MIVATLGARMHYAVPRVLHEAGLLERFYTDSYIGNKPLLEAVLKIIPVRARPRGLQRWLGRRDEVLPPQKVVSFEFFGWNYVWLRHRSRTGMERSRVHANAGRSFSNRIIATHPRQVDAVWGFNGACLELFQWAKARGIRCVVEQTIAPRRVEHRLLSEEFEYWPGWQADTETMCYPDPLSEREEAEWALADLIVAGSEFVAEGLRTCKVSAGKIRVVPYGVDVRHFQPADRSRPGPLRILFAGEVGLRKGVPYLLQALHHIGAGQVDVRMAGRISLAPDKIAPFRDLAELLGPAPRSLMASLFSWADVLVLPSIVEGSAIVIYEALSSGLPVITTPNAGSVVRNGIEGFVLPIRDVDALQARIADLAADRNLLSAMGEAARARALDFTLERYRDRLLDALGSIE
jgi:glycosyltransferase involved in cell wall biosynthesis